VHGKVLDGTLSEEGDHAFRSAAVPTVEMTTVAQLNGIRPGKRSQQDKSDPRRTAYLLCPRPHHPPLFRGKSSARGYGPPPWAVYTVTTVAQGGSSCITSKYAGMGEGRQHRGLRDISEAKRRHYRTFLPEFRIAVLFSAKQPTNKLTQPASDGSLWFACPLTLLRPGLRQPPH